MNIKNLRKNKKGFTLIEIIVVVVILAVLLAVAVPSVLKYMGEADNAKYMSQARGAYIVMQHDLTKAVIKDGTLNSTAITDVLDVCEFSGKPEVAQVGVNVKTVSKDAMPTKYYVKFDDKHYATLEENGSVEISESISDDNATWETVE